MQAGQFPAAALVYRKGYVKQGEPVVVEDRRIEDLWNRHTPVIGEYDEGGPYTPPSDPSAIKPLDPLAYLAGPVKVKFADGSGGRIANLQKYVDADHQLVRSNTGELALDFGAGICTINSPKAQGVCGFLKEAGGRFELQDLTIESANDYAAIIVVPLDDKPLRESGRVLVQIGTTARPTGWATQPQPFTFNKQSYNGQRITSIGQGPWRVADTRLTLRLRNPAIRTATRLDILGYAAQALPIVREGDRCTVTLPPNTLYLVLGTQ